MTRQIVIGGAAGMWGDSVLATPQLLADGRCDYLIYEGLAEITMAILTKARNKDPQQGYARDLIAIIGNHLTAYREQRIKVVTNAGGVNPAAAAQVLTAAAEAAGIPLAIATVTGDDVLEQMNSLPAATVSANAYLGARPIAAALDAGADIVITGRVVDSALVLGPLIHEFEWAPDALDALAGGSLAGHLLECGPQSTGGLLSDWRDTVSWADPGFPIAMVEADGAFELTVAAENNGVVDRRTASEQLLYEIGDPTAYLLPDVTCDWSQVTITERATNRVRVAGALGRPPTPTLKVCAQVADGYRAAVQFFVGGREAVAKAHRAGDDLVKRARRLLAQRGFDDFRDINVHVVGSEASYGPHARDTGSREALLWIAAHHDDRDALTSFVREFPSIGLAGPPGIGGAASAGLPKPSPVLRIENALLPRDSLQARLTVGGEAQEYADVPLDLCRPVEGRGPDCPVREPTTAAATVSTPLIRIAYGRSGDKGDSVNIGIVARRPDFVPLIADQLTAAAVADWLEHLGATRVERFALPGIAGFNFLLHQGLGASGAASLRIDPQGKAVAQQLLDFPISIPAEMELPCT